jgi:hypothetical protein
MSGHNVLSQPLYGESALPADWELPRELPDKMRTAVRYRAGVLIEGPITHIELPDGREVPLGYPKQFVSSAEAS